MKLFQNLILFTVLLFVYGQEVVLTPPTIDDTGEEQTSNWDTAPVLADLADGNGWTAPEYYSTIRVLVVDQTIWLLARGNDGMHAYKYDSASKTWDTSPPLLPDLADSNGWNAGPEYYSTIQVVGSDSIWLLARNAEGLQVYQYDLYNRVWAQKTALTSLSDANSWDQEEYYSSIQAFAISGAILVFVRDPSGEIVNSYDLDSDSWTPVPALAAFSDARNWGSDPKYYSTVQVVQLGQDFWLLGRSATGMEIAQYTNSWTQKTPLPDLSDANGWGDAEYYSTIKAVALDGNIWLFARNADGLQTYQYETESDTWTPKKSLDDLSDLNGWGSVEYYSTIQPVALSTSIALLARGPNGLQYYEYLPNSDSWDSKPTLTALSDAQNWNRPEYYTTIKGINYMDVVNVAARGIYGEELYSYKA